MCVLRGLRAAKWHIFFPLDFIEDQGIDFYLKDRGHSSVGTVGGSQDWNLRRSSFLGLSEGIDSLFGLYLKKDLMSLKLVGLKEVVLRIKKEQFLIWADSVQ